VAKESTITRGIDHVGITVPDIDAATAFFVDAFDAVVIYDLIVDGAMVSPAHGQVGLASVDLSEILGVPRAAEIRSQRMLRLGNGPSLELFKYVNVAQSPVVAPNDFGLQHVALYVDDIEEAANRVEGAGGTLLKGPNDLPGLEAGLGCRYRYARAPWGTTIELITYASTQRYESTTAVRRWKPEA
jgi:catechol 2,3-dioxygenase-like lactoylglutathione lyase family enzyme